MKYETNVFINCPFDTEFINNILKPMLFGIVKVGYTPRLSLEVSDSGLVRLSKIIKIIQECKFGIHDISIVRAKKAKEYARMNMPFELGIDYGLRNSGISFFEEKQFLILEAQKYDYMKALSDINGMDIKVHNNSTETVFECLYAWFSETLHIRKQQPPIQTYYQFMDFNAALFNDKLEEYKVEKIAQNYIENLTIPEYISEIINWQKEYL